MTNQGTYNLYYHNYSASLFAYVRRGTLSYKTVWCFTKSACDFVYVLCPQKTHHVWQKFFKCTANTMSITSLGLKICLLPVCRMSLLDVTFQKYIQNGFCAVHFVINNSLVAQRPCIKQSLNCEMYRSHLFSSLFKKINCK